MAAISCQNNGSEPSTGTPYAIIITDFYRIVKLAILFEFEKIFRLTNFAQYDIIKSRKAYQKR